MDTTISMYRETGNTSFQRKSQVVNIQSMTEIESHNFTMTIVTGSGKNQ